VELELAKYRLNFGSDLRARERIDAAMREQTEIRLTVLQMNERQSFSTEFRNALRALPSGHNNRDSIQKYWLELARYLELVESDNVLTLTEVEQILQLYWRVQEPDNYYRVLAAVLGYTQLPHLVEGHTWTFFLDEDHWYFITVTPDHVKFHIQLDDGEILSAIVGSRDYSDLKEIARTWVPEIVGGE
jgi:hypothetical protein